MPTIAKKKAKRIKADSDDLNKINFPASMPLIPMPASNFDIKSFDTSNVNNVASINAAAAAAMAAAAAAPNAPPTTTPNLWNFSYNSAYPPTSTQMLPNGQAKASSFNSNEFINSMAVASQFPLTNTSKKIKINFYKIISFFIFLDWMTHNYTSPAMLNMNMITPNPYNFTTPMPSAPLPLNQPSNFQPATTTSFDFTNANNYYPSPVVSIAAAYDFYNAQNYYSPPNSSYDPNKL